MRQRKGAIRRSQLATATFQTLQKDGLRNTSVARISKRAGLTQGPVHHYFRTHAWLAFGVEAFGRSRSTDR